MTVATVSGPSFLSLQVRDLAVSADFYESQLGLVRAPQAPPGAVVFTTSPIPFAVRNPAPETDPTVVSRDSELPSGWCATTPKRSTTISSPPA